VTNSTKVVTKTTKMVKKATKMVKKAKKVVRKAKKVLRKAIKIIKKKRNRRKQNQILRWIFKMSTLSPKKFSLRNTSTQFHAGKLTKVGTQFRSPSTPSMAV
jgi:hypothetical protein